MYLRKFSTTILLASISILWATKASATILAYEGFATDATGSGNNYLGGETLGTYLPADGQDFNGVDRTRLGYAGGWGQVDNIVSGNVNSRAIIGDLSYPGFTAGDSGMGNPFRTGNGTPGDKWVGRELTVTSSQISSGYYVAALVDFNDASGGGFGWAIPGRDNYITYNGGTGDATFTSAGTTGATATFTPTSGTNLIVVQYTTETGGSNANFYTRWNLWVNPDLNGGDLGTITATGFGIGLLSNSNVQNLAYAFLSSTNLDNDNMFVDELYITTDPGDFIAVPEPSTYALILGIATLGLLIRRRRV